MPWKAVGKWVKDNRGAVASGLATGGCLIPAVGWAACAGLQAAAYGVRAQQRASEGGGWRRTWRANAADGVFSAAGFGATAAGRNAALGGWARWKETRRAPSIFSRQSWWHSPRIIKGEPKDPAPVFGGCTIATVIPAVLNFFFKPFNF
ncbi:hypothetical protein [Kitasatospora purpeofusca]|uniref:hypothetical protein n=1 Tax=Kitasatospora purpeofusca TaxID=67352 RepID=UPI002A59AE96|nr:hypothetical protein [Kitasatospora purpeofusca]MDY0813535.1 hypothetical protein [Kitasatospora purpeofusca]